MSSLGPGLSVSRLQMSNVISQIAHWLCHSSKGVKASSFICFCHAWWAFCLIILLHNSDQALESSDETWQLLLRYFKNIYKIFITKDYFTDKLFLTRISFWTGCAVHPFLSADAVLHVRLSILHFSYTAFSYAWHISVLPCLLNHHLTSEWMGKILKMLIWFLFSSLADYW